GRYKVQARQQIDSGAFAVLVAPEAKPADWLAGHLAEGAVVGADVRLHTASAQKELAKALAAKGIKLKLLATNLVDRAWGAARPEAPMGPVVVHALKYAGKPAEQKLGELQALLRAEGQDGVVLTLPATIAGLFNLR